MCKYQSKEVNSEFLIRVDDNRFGSILHSAIGFYRLCDILGDKVDKVLDRVFSSKCQNCVVRPFHGLVITFYSR